MRGILLSVVCLSLRASAVQLEPASGGVRRQSLPTKFAEWFAARQNDVEVDSEGERDGESEDDQMEYAVRYVHNPLPTLAADIPASEVRENLGVHATDIEFVRHRHFDVSIPVYQSTDTISDAIRANGSWDTEDLQRICNAYSKHGGRGHILDVGANIGSYSLPLASFVRGNSAGLRGRVVAVEGFPKNARHLRAGIKFNNLDNVVLYEYALSSPIQDNTVEMKENLKNKGMNSVKGVNKVSSKRSALPLRAGRRGKNQLTVPVTTLDAIAASSPEILHNIFLMKMDIEGSEAEALRGALSFFQKGPCVVYVETKYNDQLVGMFEEKGYVLQTLEGPDKNAWFEARDMDKCVASLE